MTKKVFIIGSCVTRDAFTKTLLINEFSLVKYIARTTLARLVSGSATISEKNINISSAFQKRMIMFDLSNKLIDVLKLSTNINEVDFFILDLVDDRFGLIEFSEDVYVTSSDEFRKARLIVTKEAKKIRGNSVLYRQLWEAGLKQILEIIPKEKIIINDVHWASHTESGRLLSSPERISFCEDIITGLYDIAKKYIPESNFVNYPNDIFVGADNHKWGRSPFHYGQPVYDYFINFLRKQGHQTTE